MQSFIQELCQEVLQTKARKWRITVLIDEIERGAADKSQGKCGTTVLIDENGKGSSYR